MIKIKLKKLSEKAVLPTYAKKGDAGMDLTATSRETKGLYVEYGTDLALEIPTGYVGLLFPRSSVSNVTQILANCVGVIDSNYRGEIKARFKTTSHEDDFKIYQIGERVAQLIVLPVDEVEFEEISELSETNRGEGGFGHTNV